MKLRRSTLVIAWTTASAAGICGCHPTPLGQGRNDQDRAVSVAARLDCPSRQGTLERADVAADGRGCRYIASDGREARLMLVDLGGKAARDALAPTESELKALLPAAVAPDAAPLEGVASGDHDHTRIDLPGIHIEADGNKGARIRAFGQSIDAQGKGAVIHGGWNGKEAVVNAHDGGVEIREGWFGERSVDATYILASDQAGPSGVHAAAYVAKGPAAGPLVVGIETSKTDSDGHRHDERLRDLKHLVNRNLHRG